MKNTDLLNGKIWKAILLFSIPLLIGNLFQQLYNTVDSYVVGNYISSHALAAVGQSTSIINMLVGLFSGLATGAGVVISQYFGSKQYEEMKEAIHTSLALTIVLCILFTFIGIMMAHPILVMIGSPKEILPLATTYLQIYFAGVSFMLIYNMASGILRALGDSKNPLIYLAISSVVNIILDLIFVLYLNLGVAGVAIATTIAQFVSSVLVMIQLCTTKQIYKVELKKIKFNSSKLSRIISIGFPAAIQNSIVSFSNVIVQSYISSFGAAAVAGYSTTMKLDGFLQLPIQSFSMSITTFVGQNYGAHRFDRVRKGLYVTLLMCCSIIIFGSIVMYTNAQSLVEIFTHDVDAIKAGVTMISVFAPFYIMLTICHVTAGALRGVGQSKVPMLTMILCFVLLRQIYLYVATHIVHELVVVFLGWPITWVINAFILTIYYYLYSKKLVEMNK
ncbi:MAG: MATE family efflux transporter [Erysipelotrichaceae bacterium]|uniref:MATE family efflux transporter n=1 Tax=Floccifex sp. TaxID=2815810 RepID=UPI002A754301|nr:MATE family efflux transporter [Floccifex sp.]MDD7280920.1 MATE family efflux transporter [Erysipelotrichaceae bacterium]MDY2957993.1 MATE family efflux transporter [Floccifex sp.]